MPVELLVGWKAIARLFGMPAKTFCRKHAAELQRAGFVFYKLEGRPAQRRVCAWVNRLQEWAAIKASKGETI